MNARPEKFTFSLASCETAHWRDAMPYRALVAVAINQHGKALYLVAGSEAKPAGAKTALRNALKIHGGACFYCKETIATEVMDDLATLDHVEAESRNGTNDLSNLVVACKPCNREKGHQVIDAFNPGAARQWLEALKAQIEQRLARLP